MNAAAREEYQRQRKEYRVQQGYKALVGPDPVRANALYNAYQSEYRDHEIPMLPSRPGTSNHVEEITVKKESPMNTINTMPITINDESAHIITSFASTNGNLEIIRTACRKVQGWSKVDEGYMLNTKTNNNVHWVEIQSPKGEIFRVCFDVHPEHKTPTPHVWMWKGGKLRKINLYSGAMGAARRFLREKFTKARPSSVYFSLHGAHYIVCMALLLNGAKLNIVSKNPEVTQKILCS